MTINNFSINCRCRISKLWYIWIWCKWWCLHSSNLKPI